MRYYCKRRLTKRGTKMQARTAAQAFDEAAEESSLKHFKGYAVIDMLDGSVDKSWGRWNKREYQPAEGVKLRGLFEQYGVQYERHPINVLVDIGTVKEGTLKEMPNGALKLEFREGI